MEALLATLTGRSNLIFKADFFLYVRLNSTATIGHTNMKLVTIDYLFDVSVMGVPDIIMTSQLKLICSKFAFFDREKTFFAITVFHNVPTPKNPIKHFLGHFDEMHLSKQIIKNLS